MSVPSPRIMRLAEVISVVGLKKTSIYVLMAREQFPQSFKISPTNLPGWNSVAIEQFVADRIAGESPSPAGRARKRSRSPSLAS